MKIRKNSKRAAYVLATVVAVLLVSSIAFAYFTSSGDGTGSATVGAAADDISVEGTTSADLHPGGPGVTVSFTATNPQDFNQKLSLIELSGVTAPAGCDDSVFHMADVVVGAEGNLDPSVTDEPLTVTGTLYMDDNGANQDACQNGTLTLDFTTT